MWKLKIVLPYLVEGFFPPVWSLSQFMAISANFGGIGLLPLYVWEGKNTQLK